MDEDTCTIPNSLVISYALAIACSGKAKTIFLAGFDGYEPGDQRNVEMESMIELYQSSVDAPRLVAVTPTTYSGVAIRSIYGM